METDTTINLGFEEHSPARLGLAIDLDASTRHGKGFMVYEQTPVLPNLSPGKKLIKKMAREVQTGSEIDDQQALFANKILVLWEDYKKAGFVPWLARVTSELLDDYSNQPTSDAFSTKINVMDRFFAIYPNDRKGRSVSPDGWLEYIKRTALDPACLGWIAIYSSFNSSTYKKAKTTKAEPIQ